MIAVLDSLQGVISWPSDAHLDSLRQRNQDLPRFLQDCVCIVDGTRFKIKRPSDNNIQEELYSGKTKTHNLNVLFVCLFDGTPIFVSKAFPGARNDQGVWNEVKLRDRFIGKSYGIIGDKMFTFNREEDEKKIIGVSPIKKDSSGDQLSEVDKEKNKQISSIRINIEHYFALLKGWRIFKSTFRHFSMMSVNNFDFDDVLLCLVCIVQWKKTN